MRAQVPRARSSRVSWSGARRGKIQRLAVDCLDQYPPDQPHDPVFPKSCPRAATWPRRDMVESGRPVRGVSA
jgi:hypothetical protein